MGMTTQHPRRLPLSPRIIGNSLNKSSDADPRTATRDQEEDEVDEYGQGHAEYYAEHYLEQASPTRTAPASPTEHDNA
jgi:hypothetical protein